TININASKINLNGAISINSFNQSLKSDFDSKITADYVDDVVNKVKNPAITNSTAGWSNSRHLTTSMQTFEGVSTRVLAQSQVSSGQTQTYSTYFDVDPSKA